MKSILLFAAAVGLTALQAAAPAIDNERVTVWDLTKAGSQPTTPARPFVTMTLDGQAAFHKAGEPAPAGAVVVELKDHPVAPTPNTSGYPLAFPRPDIKKLLENDKVIVWDYTWAIGKPTNMHFHDKDVVLVYLEDGSVNSVTPDGKIAVNEVQRGSIRFNAGNRVHYEELVKGKSRAIITELK
jgi:hypothetical protein